MSQARASYLVGLIGDGVLPSLTPPMHEAEADAHGLRYIYRPLDLEVMGRTPDEIGDILRETVRMSYNALNITFPVKQLAIPHLDEIADAAQHLNAVNTVLIRDGKLIGTNTDCSGFAAGLAHGLPGADLTSVVQLGAGGAGSAVAYALLQSGVKRLDILDVDAQRSAGLAASLSAHFPDAVVEGSTVEEAGDRLATATGLVNCTPIGMHHHPGIPVEAALLRPDLWVSDIVYRPVDTQLLQAARALGCQVLDGGNMAVAQAVDTFRLITGLEPDRARMDAHFRRLIAEGR